MTVTGARPGPQPSGPSRTDPPAVAGAGRVTTRPARRRNSLRSRVEIGLFISPAMIVYLLFVLMPIALAAYYSVYRWNGLGPLDRFVGLDNYREAFADTAFREAIAHNFIIVGLSLAVQGPLALAVAALLNQRIRGRSTLRLVFFAPYVLSEVTTGVIWLLILQPDGMVDAFLRGAGLDGLVQLWLADPDLVLYTMFAVITWKYLGFAIILFLAGMQGIPHELNEAAAIDGAGPWAVFRRITVPLLGPTIRIWAFLSMIGSLQLFDLIYIMTGGGPANASNTMAVYMIEHGFSRSQFGYASAVAVILFLISLLVSLAYQRYVLRRDTEGALTRIAG